jgi:hypothetical protein
MFDSKTIKKYEKVTLPKLIERATKYFNLFIRKRDSEDGWFQCISCGDHKSLDAIQAGHYLSAGHNGAVRFDERNVHGQCIRCNMYLSGNLLPYRENLIQKIGLCEVEAITQKSQMRGFKWDRFALIDLIEEYKKKSKI